MTRENSPAVENRRFGLELGERFRQPAELRGKARIAVLLEELQQPPRIETSGVEVADRDGVALFPVSDQVGILIDGPAHAAFEKSEIEFRKTPNHSAQK